MLAIEAEEPSSTSSDSDSDQVQDDLGADTRTHYVWDEVHCAYRRIALAENYVKE